RECSANRPPPKQKSPTVAAQILSRGRGGFPLERIQQRAGRNLHRSARGHRGFAFYVQLSVEDARVAEVNLQIRGAGKRALDQRLRQRILDVLLQRAPQGPRAVTAIRASLLEDVLRGVGRQPDLHLLGDQVQVHLRHHQVDDLDEIVVRQRRKQD